MKRLIVIACALLFAGVIYGQTVRADSLKYYEGKVITVCHEVTGSFMTKATEKTTFLNFGHFPNQWCTIVIYEEDLKNFSYSPAEFLIGKNICVTGDVIMFISGPEIIVESEEQIRVMK